MSNNKISLAEAKQYKEQLEKDILTLIKIFEKKTNTVVTEIDIKHMVAKDSIKVKTFDLTVTVVF